MSFHPQAKKVLSKELGLEYWLSPIDHPSYEGLPVYSYAEAELLRKHKSSLTKEMLIDFYNIKLSTNCTLFEIFKEQEKENHDDAYKPAKGLSPAAQLVVQEIFKILKK